MELDSGDYPQLRPVSECDWSALEKTIRRLWWTEDKTFAEVRAVLADEHHVSVTYKPFLTRIKRWKLEKNFKEAEVATIALEILHCQTFGLKLPTCFIRDKVVTPLRVRGYARKKLVSMEKLAERAPSCPPSSVRFQNDPPQRAIANPTAYRQPEQILRGINVYILGSLDSGKWLGLTEVPYQKININWLLAQNRLMKFSTECREAISVLSKGHNDVAFKIINSVIHGFLDLVVDEDPKFLGELLRCITRLIHHQYSDIASAMLRFAFQAAQAQRGQNHPLSHICSLLRDLEPSFLLPVSHHAFEVLRKSFECHAKFRPTFMSSTYWIRVWLCKYSEVRELVIARLKRERSIGPFHIFEPERDLSRPNNLSSLQGALDYFDPDCWCN